MPDQTRIVRPGPSPQCVLTEDGQTLRPPVDWQLLPPGDAGLTRRVKAAGPSWTVQEKRGRKVFSRGVWAPASRISQLQAAIEAERSTDAYARRRVADAQRRDRKHTAYVESFDASVLAFLRFPPRYQQLAQRLARAVTTHATPVGSGTVARTERISIEQRAESAVIAWMRHQTTAYDRLTIRRVKGQRREVRRTLAAESRRLLDQYRRGHVVDPAICPLQRALDAAAPELPSSRSK